jgi:hypothetical protein
VDKEQVNYEAIIENLQRENERLRMSKLKGLQPGFFDCPVNLSSIEDFLSEHWHFSLFMLAGALTAWQIIRGDK